MELRRGIGERIRRLRERAGLTQGELARAAKITQVTLSHTENGLKPTNVDILERIAKALKLEPWQLLTDRAASHSLEDCIDTVARISRKDDATLKRVLLKVYGPKQE